MPYSINSFENTVGYKQKLLSFKLDTKLTIYKQLNRPLDKNKVYNKKNNLRSHKFLKLVFRAKS